MDSSLDPSVFLEEVQRIVIECDRSCSVCYNFIIQLSQHIRLTHSNTLSSSRETTVPAPVPMSSDDYILCNSFNKTHYSTTVNPPTVKVTPVDPLENNFNPASHSTQFEVVEVKAEVDPDQYYLDGTERVGSNDDDPYAQFENVSQGFNPEFEYYQEGEGQECSEMESLSREEMKSDSESESRTPTQTSSAAKTARRRERRVAKVSQSKCKECIWGFNKESDMQTHMRNTHKQNETSSAEISCENCHKYFPSFKILHVHSRSVKCKKVFNCEICGKYFLKKYSLKRHLMHHNGEKPFKCVRCDERFISVPNLRRHMSTHESSVCKFCHKKFTGRVELNQHYFNDHMEEGPAVPAVDQKSKEYVSSDTDSE